MRVWRDSDGVIHRVTHQTTIPETQCGILISGTAKTAFTDAFVNECPDCDFG